MESLEEAQESRLVDSDVFEDRAVSSHETAGFVARAALGDYDGEREGGNGRLGVLLAGGG